MEKRISIFGDSIAWGSWDPEGGGWVTRLRRYFETNENYDVDVYNLGVAGDTTSNLLLRFNTECLARNRHPQIIVFAIGINDSRYINTSDNPQTSVEEFQSNLVELINQAKEFSKKIIFVGLTKVDEVKTMPSPWSQEKFHSNSNVVKYNSIIKKISEEHNLPFIDLLDLLEINHLEDGLHPNSSGHKKIFLAVKDFLLSNKIIQSNN